MWKSVVGWLLILVSLFLFYEAWTYWDQLTTWAERRGPDGLVEYREEKNAVSIDGLPGVAGDNV